MIGQPFLNLLCAYAYVEHMAFSFGRDVLSTGVRVLELLAVSMPPSKVCPQCTAAVPVRRKTWKKSSMHF